MPEPAKVGSLPENTRQPTWELRRGSPMICLFPAMIFVTTGLCHRRVDGQPLLHMRDDDGSETALVR